METCFQMEYPRLLALLQKPQTLKLPLLDTKTSKNSKFVFEIALKSSKNS